MACRSRCATSATDRSPPPSRSRPTCTRSTPSPTRRTPPRASSSRPASPAAAPPPCRTSRTTGTPTSPTRSSRRSSPRPPPSCRSRARSTACPPRSRRLRSRTRACGATCTARPTAASAPHRPRPNASRWPASSRAPATRTDIAMTSSGQALVEVTGIEKRFGTTRALHDVSLSIKAGQCLGLVGRNGAGKSTLVSILSGLVEPDAGTVAFGGEPAPRVGDTARWHEWIATVFQHSMIVPDLSVAENVFLGSTPALISWRAMRSRTSAIMDDWGFDIAAGTLCRDLSVEQLQIVEIARALARGAKCVLLDEPTATLERDAGRRLFDRVRQLTDGGVAVLYISHHLEEVFEICQDVAVLRDGELVLAAPTAELSRDDLVVAMVGQNHQTQSIERPGAALVGHPSPGPGATPAGGEDVVLSVENLTADSLRGRLSGVSLQVRAGEIVGVTGLLSAGVATIGRVIGGAEESSGGQVRVRGRRVPSGQRDVAQRAGVGYIPEDRHREGF